VRLVVLIAAAVLLLLVVTQLALPRYLERRIEGRLEKGGGTANVTLEALPAVRLLAHDGDRLDVDGRDLVFEVDVSSLGSRVLDEVDGFDEVDMRLEDLRADPFSVRSFLLERSGGDSGYRMRLRASTSAGALLRYALPGVVGAVADSATRLTTGSKAIPIAVDALIVSDDGRARVVRARGTVAGLQVGPVVELVSAAILSRL
jgi:hypothetical protein